MSEVGKPMNRVDGRLKVTGTAHYSSEIQIPNLTHGVIVQSTIARGRIASIDTRAAERAIGVLGVLTHLNAPSLQREPAQLAAQSRYGPSSRRLPEGRGLLQDDVVHYSGQHIAVVIADTLEQAAHAASLVRVTYAKKRPVVDFEAELPRAYMPEGDGPGAEPPPRGDADQALTEAAVRVDQRYTTPIEHHNPMGLFATIAIWDGPRLTVYDATQGVMNARSALATGFGLPLENVQVLAPFVGGGFGAGLRAWPHPTLAAMAARHVNRPVKLVLTREQMYTSCGYRNPTIQRVVLGATKDGRLTSIVHEGATPTARFTQFGGGLTEKARVLYACPNVRTETRLVRLDVSQATPMRAPGTAEGMWALESAIDELAYAVGIDPIELRLRNYADFDPQEGHPWSSKSLKECYRLGAERFGWTKRNRKPRSMRDGRYLVGFGMASAMYSARTQPATARVRLMMDGNDVRALVETAATDIGTGTYTVLAQIAADKLGLPVESVRVNLADSNFPNAPVQGGSFLLASAGSAVHNAALNARAKAVALARADRRSPLWGAEKGDVVAAGGRIFLTRKSSVGETYEALLARQRLQSLEATGESVPQPESAGATSSPNRGGPEAVRRLDRGPGGAMLSGNQQPQYSSYSFGAQFAEVRVDPDLGEVRVTRFVGTFGAGRIVNRKTARSQMIGGISTLR